MNKMSKGTKVKCVEDSFSEGILKLGKIYIVDDLSSGGGVIKLVDTPGGYYRRDRFVIVGCPCGIDTCIKHKKV